MSLGGFSKFLKQTERLKKLLSLNLLLLILDEKSKNLVIFCELVFRGKVVFWLLFIDEINVGFFDVDSLECDTSY